MILTTLFALALLAQQPALPPAAAPAPAVEEAPPVVDDNAVLAEIDRKMAAWKGKKGDRLRGWFGLSEDTKRASDGIVMFWRNRSEATACGIDDAGRMVCGVIGGSECVMGVAFELDGTVKGWKASGSGEACQKYADAIGAP